MNHSHPFLRISAVLCLINLYAQAALAQSACSLKDSHLVSDTELDPRCTYQASLSIDKPLTLDCRGAVIDGGHKLAHGLIIDSKGSVLANVVVKNCTFRRFTKDGVLIHWSLPNDQKVARYSAEERYQLTPHDIVLSHVRIEQNGYAGIVLDDYVQSVTMDALSVVDNDGWGLYWDNATRGNVLSNSEVRRNGRVGHKPGLAIDASSDNRVVNSVFEANGRAAIELYRNCWEFAATNPHSILRESGANRNVISGNRFVGETVGVWIASRMSRDLRSMQCGRPAYYQGKYVEDEARSNLVSNNRFYAMVGRGVVVEDDDNSVLWNSFDRADSAIEIGTEFRKRALGRPVRGTLVDGNQADEGGNPVHLMFD